MFKFILYHYVDSYEITLNNSWFSAFMFSENTLHYMATAISLNYLFVLKYVYKINRSNESIIYVKKTVFCVNYTYK